MALSHGSKLEAFAVDGTLLLSSDRAIDSSVFSVVKSLVVQRTNHILLPGWTQACHKHHSCCCSNVLMSEVGCYDSCHSCCNLQGIHGLGLAYVGMY